MSPLVEPEKVQSSLPSSDSLRVSGSFRHKNLFLILCSTVIVIIVVVFILMDVVPKYRIEPYRGPAGLIEIQQKVNLLSEDGNAVNIEQFYQAIRALESGKLDKEKQYAEVKKLGIYVSSAYGYSHNKQYRELLTQIGALASKNYPDYYKEEDFSIGCQDPSCAESGMPEEIQSVIDDIQKSNIPDYLKQNAILNLQNASYLSNDSKDMKYMGYSIVLKGLKSQQEAGNKSIESVIQKLENYMNENLSEEAKKFEGLPQ